MGNIPHKTCTTKSTTEHQDPRDPIFDTTIVSGSYHTANSGLNSSGYGSQSGFCQEIFLLVQFLAIRYEDFAPPSTCKNFIIGKSLVKICQGKKHL